MEISGLGGIELISLAGFSLKKINHIPAINPEINKKAPAAKIKFLVEDGEGVGWGLFAASAAISRTDNFFRSIYSEISPFRV